MKIGVAGGGGAGGGGGGGGNACGTEMVSTSRVQALATHVPLSIVSRYLRNPTPPDPTSPDIVSANVPVMIVKFYSLAAETTRGHSAYLQYIEETFNIITEEGGDILQVFNGEEIIAMWRDTGEEPNQQNPQQQSLLQAHMQMQAQQQQQSIDPLFNIFIGCGDIFHGSLGGENNSWQVLIGGEGLIQTSRIVEIYEEKYGIQSFPVRLSLSRNYGKNVPTQPTAGYHTKLRPGPHNLSPSSLSPNGLLSSVAVAVTTAFGQILITPEAWQLVRLYIQSDPVWTLETTSLSASSSGIQQLELAPLHHVRHIQELSNPVGIQIEMAIKDMTPDHLIAMHKLLWCHLPVHVKVLASALMSNPRGPPTQLENFRLNQEWTLETRSVTFIVIHLFSLALNWDTLNFFHPVLAKIQEVLRRADGTVVEVLQRRGGVFIKCAMGLPPFSNHNHSVAGIKTALDLVKLLASHSRAFIRDANVLVLTEKVVCGLVGTKTRTEYVIIGDKIHHSMHWLDTVHEQTTFHKSVSDQHTHIDPSEMDALPSDGGWVLCDDTTRRACDKAITFDAVTYDIQFPLSLVKGSSLSDTQSNASLGSLGVSTQQLRVSQEPNHDSAVSATLDESMSVTFSLKSSVSSEMSEAYNNKEANGTTSHTQDQSLPWLRCIATMITYRPTGVAHTATTTDRQESECARIVGRKKEMSSLMTRFSSLTERLVSSFTLIEADLGVGKSSLVTELYKECVQQGATVLCGSASVLEKGRAYNVWTGVFSDLFFSEFSLGETRFAGDRRAYRTLSWTRYQHVQAMPPERIRAYIFQKFTDQRPEIAPLLSLLNPVLRIDFPPNAVTEQYTVSTSALLDKTFELLSYFLRLVASRRRLVVVLEDVQYMDAVSWAFLMHVSFTIRPIMIVATTRTQADRPPELLRIIKAFGANARMPMAGSPRNPVSNPTMDLKQMFSQADGTHAPLSTPLSFEYHEMQLPPLAPNAIREIVRRVLGVRVVSNYIYHLIHTKSEGNPFICLELTKSLREREFVLVHENRCFVQPHHFTKGYPAISDSLETFFMAKVNHLSNIFTIILKVASVMGLVAFPYTLMHLVYPIGSKRPFLRDIMQRLVDLGLLANMHRSQLTPLPFHLPAPPGHPSINDVTPPSQPIKPPPIRALTQASISKSMTNSSILSILARSVTDDEIEFNSPDDSEEDLATESPISSSYHSTVDPLLTKKLRRKGSLIANNRVTASSDDDWSQYYTFKSPLLQESLYNTLLLSQRQSLHLKIAKWIEDTYTRPDMPHYTMMLSEHWSKTDLSQPDHMAKALEYTYEAGNEATKDCIYFDMIRYHNEYLQLFRQSKSSGTGKHDSQDFIKVSSFGILNIANKFVADATLNTDGLVMTPEEKLRYIVSVKRIGEAYVGLGYLIHAEQYFLHALSVLKEPAPRASSSVVMSVLTQMTRQNFFKSFSKSRSIQLHNEEASVDTPMSTLLVVEMSKSYSALSELYFKASSLPLALHCAMKSVAILEPHQHAPISTVGPQLAKNYATLSIISSIFPLCGGISQSLTKQTTRIVDDLLVGYLERNNTEATNLLLGALAIQGLHNIYTGQWDRAEEIVNRTTQLYTQYPQSFHSKERELILYVFVAHRLIRGDLVEMQQMVDEYCTQNTSTMSWMATLTFYHLKALSLALQSRFPEAMAVVSEAEVARPTSEGIEYLLQQAITAGNYYHLGQTLQALDEISKVTSIIGENSPDIQPQPQPVIQINGIEIPLDNNYGGQSNSTSNSVCNGQQYEIDIPFLESLVKKLLAEIKAFEKGAPFSTTSHHRLSGLYTIIFQIGGAKDSKQRGLALLYKSAKEGKALSLPIEEAFAWHEISRYEEPQSAKQQLAQRNSQECHDRIGIVPWNL
eukprot:gene16104-19161_t